MYLLKKKTTKYIYTYIYTYINNNNDNKRKLLLDFNSKTNYL